MKKSILYSFIVASILLSFGSCTYDVDGYGFSDQVIMEGDSMIWKEMDYDDSHWENYLEYVSDEIYWLRFEIDLPEDVTKIEYPALKLISIGSYEAYWDGVKIGESGELPTEDKAEVIGPYWNFFMLEDSMVTKGKHVLSMRTYISRKDLSQHAYFILDDIYSLTRLPLQITKYMFLIGGGLLIAAFYFFVLFIYQRKDFSSLLLAIICLVILGIFFLEYLKLFYPYPYPFQRTRLEYIGYLHILLTFGVPLTFCLLFQFPYKKYLFALLAIVVMYIEYKYHMSFDFIAKKHNLIMWIFSTIVIVYAIIKGQKTAYIILFGSISAMLVLYIAKYIHIPYVSPYDVGLFLSFIMLILSILISKAIIRKSERKAYEASLILSERLKTELLKKNIKPHFIMNTLTSLIDWVEDSPKEGVRFIHALAGEFEVLNEMADQKLVPIGQEIRLCRNHLDVMSFRKEINYTLETHGIDENDSIPPAIFHTIIENGVTHGMPSENGDISFILRYEKSGQVKKYSILCISKIRVRSTDHVEVKDGTGLKYIKSRLQESYPDRWTFNTHQVENGWLTEIEIK